MVFLIPVFFVENSDAWLAYSIYYALFPALAFYDAKYKPDFRFTDKVYVLLSFTSKMALLWITVGAIMANVTDGDTEEGWIAVVRTAEIVPAVALVASVAYLYMNKDTQDITNADVKDNKGTARNMNSLIF